MAKVRYKEISERDLKAIINPKSANSQLSLDLFEEVTNEVVLKGVPITFYEMYDRLRRQFELAYGGDLFSSDVAEVVNEVEQVLNESYPKLLLNLIADTSEDRFNFRYEDLPPEMIQEFYETSMGHALQMNITENGETIISYSDDLQNKKHKGAYYTKQELVDYIIKETIGSKVDEYQGQLKEAINAGNEVEILEAIEKIVGLTVIDITCGGGSFLRGAFRYLASKREGIIRTLEGIEDVILRDKINEIYPYFDLNNPNSDSAWERHILLRMIYGIDLDYKALIISSQTLTLSALSKWQIGRNFPQLIGLTLIHQNALISSVRVDERNEIFSILKQEIKQLIKLRKELINEVNAEKAKNLGLKVDKLRLSLQEKLFSQILNIIGEYRDALMPEAVEINFPEVFFNENGEMKKDGGFTVCVGNPPWEVWKPNAEEFFEVYDPAFRKGNKQEKLKKMEDIFRNYPKVKDKWNWLQGYYEKGSDYFLQHSYYDFQKVKVDNKLTGGDINLYKIATERCYQLLQKDGCCGYLVPSNIYTDQGSTGIRNMLFEHCQLNKIASFENRRGIFPNVHRSYKFAIMLFNKGGNSDLIKAFFYKLSLDALHNEQQHFIEIPVELIKSLSPKTFSIMEFRTQQEVKVMQKLTSHPLLDQKLMHRWNLQLMAEFHMTSDSELFNKSGVGLRLLEGKHIWQFESSTEEVNYHIDQSIGEKVLFNKEVKRIEKSLTDYTMSKKLEAIQKYFQADAIPASFVQLANSFYRLAFREVASSTNKRSLIATIVPKNSFLGNTIVSAFPFKLAIDDTEIKYIPAYTPRELLVIIGLFNSFVVDFIIRRKITNHLNMFYVYQLPVPRLMEEDLYFEEIMKRSAMLICTSEEFNELKNSAQISKGVEDREKRQLLQNQIDAYVAKIYGLNRDEFIYILRTFESTRHAEEMTQITQGVIEQFDILCEKGELICPIQ